MLAIFKKIYPFAKPHMKQFILASLCMIPVSAIPGYQAYYVQKIFDEGLAATSTTEFLIGQCLFLISLQAVQYPFRVYHYYTLKKIVQVVTCDIRAKLFHHYQRLPLSFFDEKNQGEILSISTYDTLYFANAMNHVVGFVREPLKAIVLLGVACYHDWVLALFILAAVPLFSALLSYTGKKIKKHTKLAQAKVGNIAQGITEAIKNHKTVKAYNLHGFLERRFEKFQNDFLVSQNKAISYEEHSYPSIETIGTAAICLILMTAHERISGGHLSTGAFISFAAAMSMFMDPVKKFNRANVGINQARAAADRIFGIIDINEEVDGLEDIVKFEDKIEFRNITFQYKDEIVLKDFNFTIKKGERVGLVGRSGSGKSTVISLLLGLYQLQEGDILIDGKSIKDLRKSELRKYFSYVGQDVFLFQDSVYENLSLEESYSDEKIEKALRSVQGQFVYEKPAGLKTEVGDRGSLFSGGETQRITLGRAILQNREVFLFDEATSALDNKSEQLIKDSLEQILVSKTVIAVAHRLSTLQSYDRILVMEYGRIIEEGSHQELLQKEGEYKKLYELSLG